MAHNPDPTHQGIPHIGLKNDSGMSTWSRQTIETQIQNFLDKSPDLSGLEISEDGRWHHGDGTVMRDAASSPKGHNLTALQGMVI